MRDTCGGFGQKVAIGSVPAVINAINAIAEATAGASHA